MTTYLYTDLRPPAQESRRQELDELIKALDQDNYQTSLFKQFNALHPKLGDTLEEVEDFKRSGKIPAPHVLDGWREMGQQASAKGHDDLGQALTSATEIYGHLREIQASGDITGATMGLLSSLQGGFSKSKSNGGFVGGLYQKLNDLSMQISAVYAALAHQIEAANQRNIREHQTTRYNLAVMGQGITDYLSRIQRSSREQGAFMVQSMQKLDDKIGSLAQNTIYMLDELAMDPFQQALFSINSQVSQAKLQPERVPPQLETLERWLKCPRIQAKLNGTFYADRPESEQLAFLQGVQPTSSQFIGFLAQALKQEGARDLPNIPVIEAILGGYEKAETMLIEAKQSYDPKGRMLQEMKIRLVTMSKVIEQLKSREVFVPFVKEQHNKLVAAQKAANEAVEMACKAVTDPLHLHVHRTLKEEFQRAVEQTFDQTLHPYTRARPNHPDGCAMLNFLNPQDRDVIAPIESAIKKYRKQALEQLPYEKMLPGKEEASSMKPVLHYAILQSPVLNAHLRTTLLPLRNLSYCSESLQKALLLESIGTGRVTAEACLNNMQTFSDANYPDPKFFVDPAHEIGKSFSVTLNIFYTLQDSFGVEKKVLIQDSLFSLPSVNTDPLVGVFWSHANGMHISGFPDDTNAMYGYNGDALGLMLTARWDNAVQLKSDKDNEHNKALMNTKLQETMQAQSEKVHSHMTYEATAARAKLDQAKMDYEHARMMICLYAEWMGIAMPKYPIVSSKVQGEFLKPLPPAPVFRESGTIALETKIESLQHTIILVQSSLAARKARQADVEDEQQIGDEMRQLKARVEAQDKKIQDLMTLVLMHQRTILQMQQKE